MLFHKEYEFLSNFYREQDNSTVEHRYQAAKATNSGDYNMIMMATSPSEAKRLGRQIKVRCDWKLIKYDVMKSLVMFKFLSDPELGKRLTKVHDDIVEENFHHDNLWGNCICEACTEIEGKNWLGEILTEVRSIVINAVPVEMDNEFDINNI